MVKKLIARVWIWLAGIAAAGCYTSFAELAANEPPANSTIPGLVAEQPAEGRFVKVDGGYMVPYTETIPGTDITFEMVPVPGGEFLMGSPPSEADRADDEGPQVRVKVDPFWIAKHEVTWAEYQAFMAMYDAFKKLQLLVVNRGAGDSNAAADDNWRIVQMHAWNGKLEDKWDVDAVTAPTPLYDSTFTYGVGDQPNQPAVTVTPFAAKQYTKWLSGLTERDYRLPTEAEWEYAARAGTTTAYSFGDDASELENYAWFEDNGDYQTHPVGSKQPNPWGLHDIHGNVAEWTLDEYEPAAYAKLGGGTVESSAAVQWPKKTYPRVIRGGSWFEPATAARSAARHKSEEQEWKLSDPNIPLSPWWYTEEPATAVGMRIMRPLKPLSADEKNRVWEADVDDIRQDVRDRLREGRGALGMADETLPAAVKAAEELDKNSQR
jgi:formylglycine-generating enzyme required for sulfatase activity